MSKKKTKTQVIKKRVLGIGLKITLFLLLSVFLSSLVISIPAVQTYIINRISDAAFDRIGHNLDIEYINIKWFDTVLLKGLVIYDTKNEKMIKVDRMILDFKIGELLAQNGINLDKAILQSASVNMLKNAPDDQFNLNFFIAEIKDKLSRNRPEEEVRTFRTDRIVITDSRYHLYRADRELITYRFDQYHFTLKALDAKLNSFMLKPGVIDFDIEELQCVDSATGLVVNDLQTKFKYTRQSMVFQNMEVKTGRSTISQSMVFDYLQPSSVKHFVDSVKITANVKRSVIYSEDLAHFAPALRKYNEYYHLTGFLEGPVNRFTANNIKLRFGLRSELQGYVSMYGLPDFEETFIDAKIKTGRIHVRDLEPYSSEESIDRIEKFGLVKMEGGFSGFPHDFVSNSKFITDIGNFSTDINLKIGTSEEKPTYSGKLTTTDFDLGRLLGDTLLYQNIDMDGSIRGSGFARDNAKFDLVSTISRLGVNGYDYKNITTDATLAEQFFNGNLRIEDSNLEFAGNVSMDLNREQEIIKVNAELGKAVLDTMRITKKPAFLSSKLNVDMRGLSLDEIVGDIFLDSTYFMYDNEVLEVDRFKLISENDSLGRTLRLNSPLANMYIAGDFDYTTLFNDIQDVFKEYSLIFRNNSEEIRNYYASNKKEFADYYYLDYDINLKNINPVFTIFYPDFYLSKETKLVGSFTGGPSKLIELETYIDTLELNKVGFIKNDVKLNTQKSSDTTLVYATYEISSGAQQINKSTVSENMICNVNWDGNLIDYNFNVDHSTTTSYARTAGSIEFLPDTTVVIMQPSEINIIDKIWKFRDYNMLLFTANEYIVENLSLFYDNQKVTLNGKLSQDPDENLFISIVNFNVNNINPLINKKLDGVVNGFIDVKDYFKSRQLNSRVNVKDFKINNFLVGNVMTLSEYDNKKELFDVSLNVERLGVKTMVVEGDIKPTGREDQLNLTATFTDANLNLIEPFFDKYISDVSGYLNGEIAITGAISNPELSGIGSTKEGYYSVDYLKTNYWIEGDIEFDKKTIDFNNFTLIDENGNTGEIVGKITHSGFKELEYDFNGTMDKLLVLNTTTQDNRLYYGSALTTGTIRFFGKEKILNIYANAVSEKGTRFFIPLGGSSEVVQEDFINFVSVNDTVHLEGRTDAKKIDLAGINLNFDLDITPDAYCEIIFDINSGDIIRGRGNGQLKLQIDTKGDFNMFGDYTITEGAYNFTLYNIINKEFEIEPGSKINWIGDPYEAILDINANYEQLASLIPIIRSNLNLSPEEIDEDPELKRKYPAKVLLDIKGNLLYPEINFDIGVEDYPKNKAIGTSGISTETMMTAFKNKLATDEQELKRQVFSLIILKKFSEENAFNVSGSVGSSVSEFISNQISYWITQFDENLVIDVDLGSLDNEAFNTFQLRMSYSFLDGRLRVTRDGGFTDQTTGADVQSILGNWSVEYLLRADGRLRVKIYNRTNYNTLDQNIQRTSTTTAGFSLLHTKSFDELKQIFQNMRKRERKIAEQEEEEEFSEDDPQGISQRPDSTRQF